MKMFLRGMVAGMKMHWEMQPIISLVCLLAFVFEALVWYYHGFWKMTLFAASLTAVSMAYYLWELKTGRFEKRLMKNTVIASRILDETFKSL